MNKKQQLIQLRTRKLGVLIYDARLTSHRGVEECSAAIGIPTKQYKSYESGQRAPSLPELEALSFFLNMPLNHFWSNQVLSDTPVKDNRFNYDRLRQLRDRIIGVRLRQLREQKQLTIKMLAEITSIPETKIKKYESGQLPIPVPEVELISNELGIKIEDLFDQHGPIGNWRTQQELITAFMGLTPEIQDFIIKSVNHPYLELAIRLSGLSVEKLRAVAEGLLEITF